MTEAQGAQLLAWCQYMQDHAFYPYPHGQSLLSWVVALTLICATIAFLLGIQVWGGRGER